MATVQDLIHWKSAVEHLDGGRPQQALDELLAMRTQTSKTRFNIAIAHDRLDQPEKAIQMLSETLHMDAHFSIGYLYRGCLYFKHKRYQDAMLDFERGQKSMRDNRFIDYNQLGMRFKVEVDQFRQNQSLCNQLLGIEDVYTPPDMHFIPYLAMVPSNLCFLPPKSKVANIEKTDFLGQAKVVVALNPEDNFAGFSGPRKVEASRQNNASRSPSRSPQPRHRHGDNMAAANNDEQGAPSQNSQSLKYVGGLLRAPAGQTSDPKSQTAPARINTNVPRNLPPPPNRPMPMPPNRNSDPRDEPSHRLAPDPPAKAHTAPSVMSTQHVLQDCRRPMLPPPQKQTNDTSQSTPPPLPPKNPLKSDSDSAESRVNKRKKSPNRDSPQRDRALPGSSQDAATMKEVTVILTCNTSVPVRLPRDASLSLITRQAAQVFSINHGTFDIWHKRDDGGYEMLTKQADMENWWQTLSSDNNTDLQLWVFGK